MNPLIRSLLPEIILCAAAMLLFLLGVSNKAASRRLAPILALATLAIVFFWQFSFVGEETGQLQDAARGATVISYEFARYVKLLTAGLGVLLVLLAWPTDPDATGGRSINFGTEAGEFFGLMLLSIAGVFLVAGANDVMLLFLGIELASLPTYIMVSISRPLPVAQEAGVKYFFLGAMAAAIMLFGFSYLYGTTGTTKLDEMTRMFGARQWSAWQLLAVVMLIGGFAFKMAAVPLHMYAGDVYQGAATPVTAFLSYVPKASGFVALIKVLYAFSGSTWAVPHQVAKLIWVLAALTMTVGNVLGLLQFNVKRVLAYSSIAHTGYMLTGIAALLYGANLNVQQDALQGVIFYLTAYGLMNIGAFGVLILLPSRSGQPATSAETFEDLAGLGRRHVGLGLAMAVSCFSLIGLPLTVGFFGKFYLIKPALEAGLDWLVIILVVNAAISAAYYLKIVAALFLRPEPATAAATDRPFRQPYPVLIAVGASIVGVLGLGVVLPMTQGLIDRARITTQIEQNPPIQAPPVASASSR